MTEHKENFTAQIKRLADYFGLKITKSQVDFYYEQLYYIEYDALKLIVDRIISDRKPFKTNFPIISEFGPLYESLSSFDKPVSKEFQEEECAECDRIGLLFYKYWNHNLGVVYSSKVACSKCSNWRKHFNTLEEYKVFSAGAFICRHPKIPSLTRFELEQKTNVLEIAENGVFKLTREQLSKKIEEMQIYGKER